jgi:hypothetical protein
MERNEIWGTEFDWYASDCEGRVALFSSAGSALVPSAILEAPADVELLDKYFQVASPMRSDWEQFAALGLFVYDCGSMHDDTYRRVAVPATPLRRSELPESLARAVGTVCFSDLRFADTSTIEGRQLK